MTDNERRQTKLAAIKATMQLVADEAKLEYKGGQSTMGHIVANAEISLRLRERGRYSWNSDMVVQLSVDGDVYYNLRTEIERKHRKMTGDPVKDRPKILELIKEAGKCLQLVKEQQAQRVAAQDAQVADRAAVAELVKAFEAQTGLKLFENTWGHGHADLSGLRQQELGPIQDIDLSKETTTIKLRVPTALAAKFVNAIRELAKEGQP